MSAFELGMPWTEKRISEFSAEEVSLLFSPSVNLVQDQALPITNLMTLLFEKTEPRADLNQFKHRQHLVQWYEEIGKLSYGIDWFTQLYSGAAGVSNTLSTKQWGINLIGYARATTGLGEDVRQLSNLLEKLSIPFCTISLGHPADCVDHAVVRNEACSATYPVSIFCMNLLEFETLSNAYDNFQAVFGFTVLQAPWELPVLPKVSKACMDLVDDFWAISEFVKQAYLQAGYSNVCKVRPICEPINVAIAHRQAVQPRPFTFLFVFDASSYLARKNPHAILQSFQRAFAKPDKVRLQFKVSNSHKNSGFLDFKRQCDVDERVTVITKHRSSKELAVLYQQADCYVSLHRSEGFGRTIAEACLSAKPVIATNWSGSCELFDVNSELLVDYKLTSLRSADYPHGDGQKWADVDIAKAASKMKRVIAMSEHERESIGQQNKRFVHEKFSLDSVLENYAELFEAIREKTSSKAL